MSSQYTEEEDKLISWFKDNYKNIIFGLLFGTILVFGFKYYNDLKGFNSRLDEVQAMFLDIKLKKINKITAHKRLLADLYLKKISNNFIKPVVHDDYFDVYHIFNIRHEKRDLLKKYLFDNGISTEIHYPVPPNKQKALKGYFQNDYRVYDKFLQCQSQRKGASKPLSYIICIVLIAINFNFFYIKMGFAFF